MNPVFILVDGVAVPAAPGQSVAAALLAAGILHLRDSPRIAEPRGAFCLVGMCQECIVEIEATHCLACQVAIRPGLSVRLAVATRA